MDSLSAQSSHRGKWAFTGFPAGLQHGGMHDSVNSQADTPGDRSRLSQHVVDAAGVGGGGWGGVVVVVGALRQKPGCRGVVPKVVYLCLKYTWDLYSS